MTIETICAFDVLEGRAEIADLEKPTPLVGYRWVHVDLNAKGVARYLEQVCPPLVFRALTMEETRPRTERFEDGILLNLRGVNLNPDSDVEDMVSIRIWATENQIISARVRKVFAVDTLRQRMPFTPPLTAANWILELSEGLIERIEEVSLARDEATSGLEDSMMAGISTQFSVAPLLTSVLKLRRFIGPQYQALERLHSVNLGWLDSVREELRETANRAMRSNEELENAILRLGSIRSHIDTEAAAKLNRNSYILSVVAAIFLPLGFITGLFGVNIAGMPGLAWAYSFWLLCVASVVITLGVYPLDIR